PPLEASLYRRATVTSVGPYRPRARIVRPPEGETAADRIRSLRGGAGEGPASRAVELEPEAAAAAMLEALESWGELE
ncbi:MAG: mycofactocin-associated electron transfer flavoprotein beta subunit, partial [Acidimicrobiales bacterium]